jgi:cell division protein FtsW
MATPRQPGRRGLPPERALTITVLALVFFGLVMVYSASSATALLSDGDPLGPATRQLVYAALGGIAFVFFSRSSAATLRKIAGPGLAISLFLLLIVLVPGIGTEVNGSRRWLSLGGLAALQPSELAKLAIVLWIAALAADRRARLGEWRTIMPFILVTGAAAALILVEPDLGTAAVLGGAALATLIVAGARVRQVGLVAGGAVGLAALSILAVPYRRERMLVFLDPWSDPEGAGFQVVQAQVALGSGGIHGVGLGEGLQKAFYLPEAHTDMILATVGEELGLVGVFSLLAAFAVIAWAGFRIALAAPDTHQQAIAAGLTSLVVLQAAVNAGAVMGMVPITGVPLPFVSFGGSSLIVLLASAGILVNIGRNSRRSSLRALRGGAEGGDRRERDGRARHPGAGRRRGAGSARG